MGHQPLLVEQIYFPVMDYCQMLQNLLLRLELDSASGTGFGSLSADDTRRKAAQMKDESNG